MKRAARVRFLIAALSLALAAATFAAGRPATWASPVAGVPVGNFYRVEPDLYRSAQPDAEGFQALAAHGIKCVLDVAGGRGDGKAAHGTPLRLVHVSLRAWDLRDDRVLEALRVLTDPANRPVLIHCKHGADRTGAILALYRVVVEGWSKEDAVREMRDGGYHFHSIWSNLVEYVWSADVASLRHALGITVPPAGLAAAETPKNALPQPGAAGAPAAAPSGRGPTEPSAGPGI